MPPLHKVIATVIAAAAFSASGFVNPPSAHASSCKDGNACIWENKDYSGKSMFSAYAIKNFKTVRWDGNTTGKGPSVNDKADSFKTRGKRCDAVLWEHVGHGGKAIRFNRPAKGGISADPYLKNGGGYSHAGGKSVNRENWSDRASSLSWTNCKK